MYGYTRASAYGQTSGVINGAGAQVDLYPVSFLGFYAGGKLVKRSTDELGTFNCTTTVCDGNMTRSYFGSKLGLALNGIFLLIDGKIEKVEMDNRVGNFAEETGTLMAHSGSDNLTQVTSILGYDIDSALSLGVLVQHSQMEKIKNKSVMSLGMTRYKWNDYSVMVGLGQFHTRQSTDHFTVMALFSWTGDKGVQLL